MRTRLFAAVSVLLLGACSGGSDVPVTLSITPSGAQTATGPVLVTANPPEIAGEVTWALAGPGTLSGTTGRAVTYRPPVPATSTPATVTASARGQTAAVTFTGQTPQQAKVVIPSLTADVNVTYDQNDIPHIFCAAAVDCFAVQGYLQAHDRLFQMDLFRRTAEGRLAELVGQLEVGQDTTFKTLFVTRDGRRIEQALDSALDAQTKAILDAFSAGVNAYIAFLKQNPTQMPQEYAQISAGITPNDIFDWTRADTLAIGRLQQFQLSETIEKETGYGQFALAFGPTGAHPDTGRLTAYILPKQPVDGFTLSTTDTNLPSAGGPVGASAASVPAGMGAALGDINAQMREINTAFASIREGAGSNNWVVAKAKSGTGQAMVANDPHLSLQYPPLFHLAAMTSSDASAINITGGSFPGVPGALVGRGAHVGWGVTVVGYDVTDLYQDTLQAPCTAAPLPCVNGLPVVPVPYTIKVRGGSDVTGTVLVVQQHGPIIAQLDASHVLSVRWTGHEVTNDEKAFLGLNTASAVGDITDAADATTAFAALRNYAVGAQNFVLADDQGNIGYDPHALVPRRDWADGSLHAPWIPLPGDGSAEWGGSTACASMTPAASCWVADDLLPHGVNPAKGYYATANSDPAGYTASTNPTSPFGSTAPAGLYPYLSFDWDDPTDIRYARIAEVLQAKTSSGTVSVADMQALQSDHVSLLGKYFEINGFYPTDSSAAYVAARTVLTNWATAGYDCPTGLTTSDPKSAAVTNASTLTNSAGCLLFHAFVTKLLHNVFDDDFAVVTAATGKTFTGDTGAELRALMVVLLRNLTATGTFCDDVNPDKSVKAAKTCGAQVIAALSSAYSAVSSAYGTDTRNWLWGRVHTLTTQSAAAPLIGAPFTAGPYARPGGALTVDVGNPSGTQSSPLAFAYGSGSNVRHISVMDPSAANAIVKMQLPGPERDAPFGVFASTPDLLGQYLNNQYFDFLHGHQIDNKGVSAQGFSKQ